ncbi:amino acid permease [Paludisphaera borealis]|uniref:Putative amino acid permease YhdG n=1 Tax=Paludisphaera borealis TaxID=1387353 RepID=A0A1U7CY61_9BACT|nr:amino acid permease [Paludisphaera borealis]APW63884.1 putative amino acid permease YhdG [Paludisphaera borealis]
MQWFSSAWFRRKPVSVLIDELNDGDRLHRRLGPFSLMALGVGATIGSGLYVQTGRVAHEVAGPSLMLSFLIAAVGCGFAALCYSELASMVPVAGSAYTYAYATLGELVAWIIGWDLILEYAIGSCFVANGWSSYFDSMLQHVFNFHLDPRLLDSPWKHEMATGFSTRLVTLPSGLEAMPWFNLPAVLVTAVVTAVLVIGIRESAGFNAAMVLLNIGVVLTVVGAGAAYVDPANWKPFLHQDHGWRGVGLGAARIFIAFIGFDSISTHAEEARNPQKDMPIGIIGALVICTVLYVATAAVLTGMIPYLQISDAAPLAAALQAKGLTLAGTLVTFGILAGMTSSLLVGNLSQPRVLLAMARDGLLPISFFGAIHPRFKTPWKSTLLVGFVVALGGALAPLDFLAELVSIGTLFAFVIVSASVWILRITDPDVPRPFRAPFVPFVSTMGVLVNGGLMFWLGRDNWIRLIAWLLVGMLIYLGYSRRHSVLGRSSSEVAAADPVSPPAG